MPGMPTLKTPDARIPPFVKWLLPIATAIIGGLKFTLDTHATGMKLARPATMAPTGTMGIGQGNAFLSILSFSTFLHLRSNSS
jgi:hypothetical protein